ncbi:MAG: hypothetical protein IBJ04_04570 [Hydrogenophaga sp.]|uniref:hypothetical protein n=1 Tax=Hydrogenophaga sp. TaxID=1904254 RepID=UPI00257DCB78|nr:hypothetical protein [Hydrogenophaga sp.]MBL0943579.1 hypothetical protein [Hydrogenophaga sp.]
MWFADTAVPAGLLADGAVLLPARRARGESELRAAAAPAASDAPWQASLDALLALLRAPGRRPAALSLNLSAAFVRWHLLPWPLGAGSPAELDAAVRLRLRAVHGAAVEGWLLQRAEGVPGQPVPVCAIDQALLQAVRSGLAGAGWRLHRLQPYAAAAFDHWRPVWRRGAAWLAVVEADHLTLALVDRGRWAALRSVRCHSRDSAALQAACAGLQARLALEAERPVPPDTPLYLTGPVAHEHAGTDPVAGQWLRPEGGPAWCDGPARLAWGR